ncbi:unnamed protein product [Ranitomeya imitator]|uniref:Cyclic nucleotide-binding domain-containing protein n=1 Tax=Ranitomeya imitator TaxID=111125 RepID=A0ABN9LTS0_9NEOB|nr:unnamed protein product [Ranitomeya imitator]
MAFNGTGSLVFIDDIRADKSSRMNSEVYRDILSAQIQPNAAKLIGRRFIVQMDNDPKHTSKATQEFMSAKKWNILQWPSQSPDLNPIEHAFHLLKSRLKTERPTNKQDLKAAAVKAWQSIKKEETQRLVMSMGSRLKADRVTFRRIIVKNNAKKRRTYENFIESLPFLKSLELSERLKVVDVIDTKAYSDGEQIIAQSKADVEQNEAVEIARYSRGQYFGELALVTNKPRAASAYAVGSVKCLAMDVQAFERLLGPCMEIMKRNIANYEEQLVALFGTNMDITDPSS